MNESGIEIQTEGNFKYAVTGLAGVLLAGTVYAAIIALSPSLNIVIIAVGSAAALRIAAPAIERITKAIAGVMVLAYNLRRQLPAPEYRLLEGERKVKNGPGSLVS